MKRFMAFAVSALAVSVVLASPIRAEELRIYNWTAYVDPDVLKQFTEETGIDVVYDTYDSNEILQTKLLAGGAGYDLVFPTASILPRLINAGVLQKLDKSRIPNLKYIWPEINDRVAAHDPGNEYAATYMWGNVGIGYIKERILERLPSAPLESWALAFDPAVVSKFADCGVMAYDEADSQIPSMLKYLGYDPRSHDPAMIKLAEEGFMAIRPYVRKFHASEQQAALANGDICLSVFVGGYVAQAQAAAKEAKQEFTVAYSNPKEGTLIWMDTMTIPADAPNSDAAHKFIDFVYRPEIAARLSNYTRFANGNIAAQDLVDPSLRNNPAIYPPGEVIEQSFTINPYPADIQKTVTRAWTRIKAGE